MDITNMDTAKVSSNGHYRYGHWQLAIMHHTIAATNKYAFQQSAKSVAYLWHTYPPTLQTINSQFIRVDFPSAKQRHTVL
jgi:hypothetical protein